MSDATVIDIALVSLRVSTSDIARALALLDGAERATAADRDGDARRRYVVAHAATRVLIGACLGVDAERVVVTTAPTGRPLVDGLSFSLSHSGDRAAVALAAESVRVGVDVERVRSRPHLDRLAERVFPADAYARWRTLAPRDRPRALAQRWTDVEAVLKARGLGIARSGTAGGLAVAGDPGEGWSRVAFDAGSGFVGSVAADRSPITVSTRAFRLGDALTRRDGTAR